MGFTEIFLCTLLILSSLGVILASKPVYSGLSFLITLLTLSGFYLQLSAEFTAVMQILVYAGAILVIFMFVIILFQDAHQKIARHRSQSAWPLLVAAGASFLMTGFLLSLKLKALTPAKHELGANFGSVQAIGQVLFLDYFFPFEAVILIFLVAIVGAVYIGKRGT